MVTSNLFLFLSYYFTELFFFFYLKSKEKTNLVIQMFETKDDEEVKYTNFCTLIDFDGNLNEIV